MKQVASGKTSRIEIEDLGAACVGVVLVAEADPAMMIGEDPLIGDANAIDIVGQVFDHAFGSTGEKLNMSDPACAGDFALVGSPVGL